VDEGLIQEIFILLLSQLRWHGGLLRKIPFVSDFLVGRPGLVILSNGTSL